MNKEAAFEIAKGLNTQTESAELRAATSEQKRIARQKRANANRKARNQAMRDLGLVRVRGNLGGVYWE